MLKMSVEMRSGYSWITLRGKMWSPKDLTTLEHEIETLKGQKSKGVVADFRDISFVSSQGLGVIVRLADILKQAGKKMVILKPKEEIREIIELSAVNKVIPVAAGEEELEALFRD
jgi:anti-anti-sigma factor